MQSEWQRNEEAKRARKEADAKRWAERFALHRKTVLHAAARAIPALVGGIAPAIAFVLIWALQDVPPARAHAVADGFRHGLLEHGTVFCMVASVTTLISSASPTSDRISRAEFSAARAPMAATVLLVMELLVSLLTYSVLLSGTQGRGVKLCVIMTVAATLISILAFEFSIANLHLKRETLIGQAT